MSASAVAGMGAPATAAPIVGGRNSAGGVEQIAGRAPLSSSRAAGHGRGTAPGAAQPSPAAPAGCALSKVLITVLDINDVRPQFSKSLFSTSVYENEPAGTSVITMSATDLDEGDNGVVTYSIEGPGAGRGWGLFPREEGCEEEGVIGTKPIPCGWFGLLGAILKVQSFPYCSAVSSSSWCGMLGLCLPSSCSPALVYALVFPTPAGLSMNTSVEQTHCLLWVKGKEHGWLVIVPETQYICTLRNCRNQAKAPLFQPGQE